MELPILQRVMLFAEKDNSFASASPWRRTVRGLPTESRQPGPLADWYAGCWFDWL